MSYYFTPFAFVWFDDVNLVSRALFPNDVDCPLWFQKCPHRPSLQTDKRCAPSILPLPFGVTADLSAIPGRLVGKSCSSRHQDPPYSEQTCLGRGLQKEMTDKYGSLFMRSLCPDFHSGLKRAATNRKGTE